MAEPQPTAAPAVPAQPIAWGLGTRILFRFAGAYIVLYTFPFPFRPPYKPPSWLRAFWLTVAPWVGIRVLGTTVRPGAGDLGDAADEYVRILVMLALATIASVIWSVADRARPNYDRLLQWLLVYVRLFLGAEMIGYGMAKIWPLQFPTPTLSTLFVPFGDLSPYDVLWGAMGSSRIYTRFGGVTEVLGGAMLFVPRLATLGAMISTAALTNVLFLNLAYDVNVKQYSLHLLLLAVFLLSRDLRRIWDLLILHRTVHPSPAKALFRRRWLNLAALLLQLGYGGYVSAREFSHAHREVKDYQEKSRDTPFYGAWTVDELRIDGEVRPALVTDDRRWWRVIFEPDPYDAKPELAIQMTSGIRRFFYAQFDPGSTLVKLKAADDDRMWFPERFRGQPPAPFIATLRLNSSMPGLLQLEGNFEGHLIQTTLRRTDVRFLLLNRGFHWLNDRPFWTR